MQTGEKVMWHFTKLDKKLGYGDGRKVRKELLIR